MIIRDLRVYRAQAALLALTAIGTLSTLLGTSGLLIGTVIGGAGFVLLQRAWRVEEPDKRLAEGLAAMGLATAIAAFLLVGLMEALVLLLLGVQLALSSQLREHRQLKFGWTTSFVVLMVGAVETTSDSYLLAFCGFALCLVLGLGYAWLDRNQRSGAPPKWSFASQWRVASAWLFVAFVLYLVTPRLDPLMLGSGGVFGGGGYSNRQWEHQAQSISGRSFAEAEQSSQRGESPSPSAEPGTGAGSAAGGGVGVGKTMPSSSSYQGFNDDSFDITEPDPQDQRVSNVEVLSMRARHSAYLRVRVFDRFDGVSWHNTLSGFHFWRGNFGEFRFDDRGRESANFNQQIEVLEPLAAAIPGAAPAISLLFPADALKRTEYGTYEAPAPLQPRTEYTVESQVTQVQGRLMDRLSPAPRAADLQLPDQLDPRIAKLARQVAGPGNHAMAQAIALETHLRDNYEYSLESVFSSQNQTPLPEFLFETRRGHCEYFASALAVMLRTLGVPTRLATGYSATTYNPVTGRYEIRVLDGHAWVEAWVGGGWMLFEATPFYPLPEPQQGRLTAEQIETYLERLTQIEEALGEPEGELDPQRLLLGMWQAVIEAANLLIAVVAWLLLVLWPLWLALTLAAIGAYLLWRFRRDALLDRLADWRVRRYRFSQGAADFHFVFTQAQGCAERRGCERSPGQSLAHYCERLLASGQLSHSHEQLVAASGACFEASQSWQGEWKDLLLAFYADLRSGLRTTPRA